MNCKKIVITGATSFLGAAVVHKLLQDGHTLYSVVRPDSVNLTNLVTHERNHIVYVNLDEIEKLCESINEADVFIHFGWSGIGSLGRSNPEIQKKNLENSKKALLAAEKLGCSTFIFSGSQAEYGIQREHIKESNICHPVSEYGKAKLEFGNYGKEYCKKSKLKFIHLRIFSVYGPGDHPTALIPSCISSFENGECMKLGECTQLWNYLYISDFADVFSKLINVSLADSYYVLNVAGDDTRVLREYVEELYARTCKKGSFVYGVRPQNAEGPAPLDPDITEIKKLLKWKPKVTFQKGIDTLVALKRR